MARVVQIALLAVDRMSRPLREAAEETDRLAAGMERLNKVSRAGGMAIAAGGAASLAGAMAPAVAAVAALPAAMAASKVASATLKVAMVGVGEAMSAVAEGDAQALNEALKDLSPSARAFVKETAALKGQWDGLQKAVQERMFAGLAADLRTAGGNLLPTMKTGMVGVAGALNGIGKEALRVGGTAWFKGELAQVFSGTTGIVKTLKGAVEPLIRSVLILVNAGQPLAKRMAEWAVNGIKAAAVFLRTQQATGGLSAKIGKIGDGFETAGRIGKNLALTIGNIAGEANSFGVAGGGMISTLETLSARMLTWSQSSQGQGQSGAVFATLGEAANNLLAVLPILTGALGILAKILTSIPEPMQGIVSSAISWGLVLSILITRLRLVTVATLAWSAATKAASGIKAASMATVGLIQGLRNVNLAYAASSTRSQVLGAALRAQATAWRVQAAAAMTSARATTASALASVRARVATIAQTVASKAAAVAARVWAAGQWILNAALTANPIGLLVAGIVGLIAIFVLAYAKVGWFRTAVQAAWSGIKAGLAAAWSVIRPIFDLLKRYVAVILVGAFKAYLAYVKLVWSVVSTVVKAAWNGVLKPIFNLIKWFVLNVLIAYYKMLWSVAKTVWAGISSVIRSAWNNGIRPTFDRLKAGVSAVRSAFSSAVSAIKTIWDRLKSIAKVPVNFLIGTVYNKGVAGLVNKIASFAGIKARLPSLSLLAAGGTLANPAAAGPMMTRGPMAIVGEGRRAFPEYVIPTDPAHRSRAQELWAAAGQALAGGRRRAMGGEGLAFAAGGTLQALEGGGVIGSFLGGLKDFSFLNPVKAFGSALRKIMPTIPGSGTFRDAIAGIPPWLLDKLTGWFKAKVGAGGTPGMRSAMDWAKRQAGKPYVWGGVGPGGYDCSGFMSAITNVIKGRNPYSRLFTTFGFTGASAGPQGFRRGARSGFEVGVTNAGVGHMAGTLLGKAVESSGSAGVRVGGGARGAGHSMFPMRYGLKADSGALTLRPGWNPPTFNGTGRPELLQTPRVDGGRSQTINLTVHLPLGANPSEAGRQIAEVLREYARRGGKLPTT